MCLKCGFVNYLNPKVVVGAVSTWEDKILLVKRAIQPQKGYWTIPAGFLETGETIEEGAVRETWELLVEAPSLRLPKNQQQPKTHPQNTPKPSPIEANI